MVRAGGARSPAQHKIPGTVVDGCRQSWPDHESAWLIRVRLAEGRLVHAHGLNLVGWDTDEGDGERRIAIVEIKAEQLEAHRCGRIAEENVPLDVFDLRALRQLQSGQPKVRNVTTGPD